MNKTIKRKMIGSIICFLIGGLALFYTILNRSIITNELNSYLSGFTCGIIFVGAYLMYLSIIAIKNPQKGKELENSENDERIKMISNESMAITFKISLLLEAIISIILAFTGKIEISEYIGFIISFQLVIYLIAYYNLQRKN